LARINKSKKKSKSPKGFVQGKSYLEGWAEGSAAVALAEEEVEETEEASDSLELAVEEDMTVVVVVASVEAGLALAP
jgi:hypothetical protein